MIIGLDLATKTGWAIGEGEGQDRCGVWDMKSRRFEGGGMRYLRFREHLADLLRYAKATDKKIKAVYFEEVRRHMSTDAAHVHGGLLSILTAFCEEHEIPYAGIPVGTIKKHATGNGNAPKSAMIEAATAKWSEIFIEDDNAADALWILDAGREGLA